MQRDLALIVTSPDPDVDKDGFRGTYTGSPSAEGRWLGEVELQAEAVMAVATAADVVKYVANIEEFSNNGVVAVDISDNVKLTKHGVDVLTIPGDGPALHRGTIIMLAQYLVFALDNEAATHKKAFLGVQAMFDYFAHAPQLGPAQARERLKALLNCIGDFKLPPKLAQDEALSAALIELRGSNRDQRALQILKDHLGALERLCKLANLSRGYLEVFVRSRPGMQLKWNDIYAGYHTEYNNKCKETDVLAVTSEEGAHAVALSVCGEPAGTYSDVFGETATNADVARRLKALMQDMRDGQNVAIFGYGYSGSGKTYTLLGSKKDATAGAISQALALLASDASAGLQKVRLSRVAIESIEFRIDNANTVHVNGKERELFPAFNDEKVWYLDDLGISNNEQHPAMPKFDAGAVDLLRLNGDDERTSALNRLIDATATEVGEYNRRTFRVRPTPNNVESSRVHTYIELELTFGSSDDKGKPTTTASKLTIIDMAGRESPSQILKDFGKGNTPTAVDITDIRLMLSSNTIAGKKTASLESLYTTKVLPGTTPKPQTVSANFTTRFQKPDKSVDVSVRMTALLPKEAIPARDKPKQDAYQAFINTGANTGDKKMNAFTGYKDEVKDDNFKPKTQSIQDYPGFQWYKKVLGTEETQDAYSTAVAYFAAEYGVERARLFFTKFHVACTYVEGHYILRSLQQLLQYFEERKSKLDTTATVSTAIAAATAATRATTQDPKTATTSNPNNDSRVIVSAVTKDILERMDEDQNTRFVMMAHVRKDRADGLKDTLDYAAKLSASMPRPQAPQK